MARLDNIKRGRLSDAEIEVMHQLVAGMRKPTPGKVARMMNRHPATIQWRMMLAGLWDRQLRYSPTPSYRRNGRTIWRFDGAEDRLLEQLRTEGLSVTAIAERLNASFHRDRNGHSVDVRLKMLAAYREAA